MRLVPKKIIFINYSKKYYFQINDKQYIFIEFLWAISMTNLIISNYVFFKLLSLTTTILNMIFYLILF